MKPGLGLLAALILTPAAAQREEEEAGVIQEIEVRAGDTLWGVAQRYLKDPNRWHEILKYNRISPDPNRVLPGMRLKIPARLVKEHLRAARLIEKVNDVRIRRGGTAGFETATLGMQLYNDDGVRTFARSRAAVRFASAEVLRIGENSFVLVRADKRGDQAFLRDGDVRASRAEVVTRQIRIRPLPVGESDFRAKIKEDQTTLVQVYKGQVDLMELKTDKLMMTVPEGHFSEIPLGKPPEPPKILPPEARAEIELPEGRVETAALRPEEAVISVPPPGSSEPAEVAPGESPPAAGLARIQGYRVQISQDEQFRKVVYDRQYPLEQKLALRQTGLPDGRYYWRVAYVDARGAEGLYTPVKQVLLDSVPPALTVTSPPEGGSVSSELLMVGGKTDPGSRVLVNQRPARVYPDGSFDATVALRPGDNEIVVEAVDEAENVNRQVRRVYLAKRGGSFLGSPGGIAASILAVGAIAAVVVIVAGGGK